MIDFNLSPSQLFALESARAFASTYLKDARKTYAHLSAPEARFQSTLPILRTATSLGLIKSQIPLSLGGTRGPDMIESVLAIEELYAVEPSVTLTLLSNALGLSALIEGGSPEQQQECLRPFLSSGEGGAPPLASLVVSEPEGTANFWEEGGKGIGTRARREGDEWVLEGEKIWATNCAGWDFKGADLQCVLCQEDPPTSNRPAMILLVTRQIIDQNSPNAFTVLRHLETPGHTACSGPHIKYSNLRVPAKNVLAAPGTGQAKRLIDSAFKSSAAMVGAMAVGIMRTAFSIALEFAKTRTAGGSVKVVERQSVADLLVDIKMRCESARYLTWKAAHAVHYAPRGAGAEAELAYEAKISCSEAAVRCVADAMKVVGISSYSTTSPLASLMADALVLPLFDGGNVGVRRRQLQELFKAEEYEPWLAAFGTGTAMVTAAVTEGSG